jgi:hypothetical protein
MKQIASAYTYNKTSGVISLTGVNIDRDQLLLIVNTTRNVTYYNFADSTTTLQAFTQGANTSITLASSVVSASSAHTNADALTIYYDDQASSAQASVFLAGEDVYAHRTVLYTSTTGTGLLNENAEPVDFTNPLPVYGAVTASITSALPIGTNLIGKVAPYTGTTLNKTTFTSITPSTVLVGSYSLRSALTVYNEGSGLLYISAGVTCTTSSYSVRLGVGEYWECPAGQMGLAHSAVFSSAGSSAFVTIVNI